MDHQHHLLSIGDYGVWNGSRPHATRPSPPGSKRDNRISPTPRLHRRPRSPSVSRSKSICLYLYPQTTPPIFSSSPAAQNTHETADLLLCSTHNSLGYCYSVWGYFWNDITLENGLNTCITATVFICVKNAWRMMARLEMDWILVLVGRSLFWVNDGWRTVSDWRMDRIMENVWHQDI